MLEVVGCLTRANTGHPPTLPCPPARPPHPRAHVCRLQKEEFDLLVIGGGCVGAGVAWEAATRGLRVALVERGDFAAGTSGRSTKLIHGGIRYLESAFKNLDVGMLKLVQEALSEVCARERARVCVKGGGVGGVGCACVCEGHRHLHVVPPACHHQRRLPHATLLPPRTSWACVSTDSRAARARHERCAFYDQAAAHNHPHLHLVRARACVRHAAHLTLGAV